MENNRSFTFVLWVMPSSLKNHEDTEHPKEIFKTLSDEEEMTAIAVNPT